MEFATCYCPNPQCAHHGKRGFGTHLVRRGADRGVPRLLCTMCKGTFSARQGTAYFGVRAEEPKAILCAEPAGSSMWIRTPSVPGWIRLDGIAGL